jgi:cell division protein FtsW
VSLQPSEFAKITLVIVLSVWLDKIAYKVKTFNKGALFSALLMLGFIGPVIAEPDFGSTMVLGIVGGSLMLVAGVKLIHIGLFFVVGLAGFLGMVLTNKNRLARLIDFFGVEGGTLSPAAKRAAYQVGESMDAIMAGGFWGKGYGESLHKHSYLPEAHTDFVLAVGAEELGLWFIIVVLLLFSLFFVISIYIARKAADKFGKFIVYGMMVIIYFQAMFNVGVVCKALPTKGMALPFFSYGGTNLMTSLIAVGMIFSVGLYSYREGRRKLTNIKIHGG